jgi:hypothetical protein
MNTKLEKRKSVHLYCIQKECEDGTCTIDVEVFPKDIDGLKQANKRLAELNKEKDIHFIRIIKV